MASTRIVLLSDTSFANAPLLKIKLGYVIFMADKERRINIVQYGSCRRHRVSRSIMAAGVHALVLAVDMGLDITETLSKLLSREVELETYIDSLTEFNVVTKNSNLAERRLQIDVFLHWKEVMKNRS